jgi:hypothetical protein
VDPSAEEKARLPAMMERYLNNPTVNEHKAVVFNFSILFQQ